MTTRSAANVATEHAASAASVRTYLHRSLRILRKTHPATPAQHVMYVNVAKVTWWGLGNLKTSNRTSSNFNDPSAVTITRRSITQKPVHVCRAMARAKCDTVGTQTVMITRPISKPITNVTESNSRNYRPHPAPTAGPSVDKNPP